MSRREGTLKLSSNIEPRASAPLDARLVVPTLADLTASGAFPYPYVGMIVSVQAEGKAYMLTASDPTVSANWTEIGSGGEAVEEVDELPANPENKVYNVQTENEEQLYTVGQLCTAIINAVTNATSNADFFARLADYGVEDASALGVEIWEDDDEWGARAAGDLGFTVPKGIGSKDASSVTIDGVTGEPSVMRTFKVRIGEWNSGLYSSIQFDGDPTIFNVNADNAASSTVGIYNRYITTKVYSKDVEITAERIFHGTMAQWDALSEEQKSKYDFIATPDEAVEDIADAVTNGDMRAVTSNAVAKGGIYSTTETKTNKVWIDNKPIYRKVITGTYPTVEIDTWTELQVESHTNIDKVVSLSGVMFAGGSYAISLELYWGTSDNKINAKQSVTGYGGTYYIVIEYTKTTD